MGLLKIRCMRPFPSKEVAEIVKNAKFVGVLEKDISFGFEGVVYTDVCSALKSAAVDVPAANYVGGLGGRSISKTDIEGIYTELLNGQRQGWRSQLCESEEGYLWRLTGKDDHQ